MNFQKNESHSTCCKYWNCKEKYIVFNGLQYNQWRFAGDIPVNRYKRQSGADPFKLPLRPPLVILFVKYSVYSFIKPRISDEGLISLFRLNSLKDRISFDKLSWITQNCLQIQVSAYKSKSQFKLL